MTTGNRSPFKHTTGGGPSNREWWPNQLNLKILHRHAVNEKGAALFLSSAL